MSDIESIGVKKFFDVYQYITENYVIKNILWNDMCFIFKVHNLKTVTIKIPKDDSNTIFCYIASDDIDKIPDIENNSEVLMSMKDLKKYLKRIEKLNNIVECVYCHTKFIPID